MRRSETQKRGRRGSGARSAPARVGARSHRRRPGGRRRTSARLAVRACRGPGGGPPHTSERAGSAPLPRRRRPFSSSPHFLARRRSESRPAAPRPLAAVPTAPRDLAATERRGCAPQQRDPGSRRRLRARPRGWGARRWPGLGKGGPGSLTGPPSLCRRHLPPHLRVTHGPAIMANGIPGGSPTRAPRSLGPSEPPLPPFGEAVPGSIGRPLCPSDPRAAPSPPLRGPARGSWAPRPPGAWVRPRGVWVGAERRPSPRRGAWGALDTCPGLRLGKGRCARV